MYLCKNFTKREKMGEKMKKITGVFTTAALTAGLSLNANAQTVPNNGSQINNADTTTIITVEKKKEPKEKTWHIEGVGETRKEEIARKKQEEDDKYIDKNDNEAYTYDPEYRDTVNKHMVAFETEFRGKVNSVLSSAQNPVNALASLEELEYEGYNAVGANNYFLGDRVKWMRDAVSQIIFGTKMQLQQALLNHFRDELKRSTSAENLDAIYSDATETITMLYNKKESKDISNQLKDIYTALKKKQKDVLKSETKDN